MRLKTEDSNGAGAGTVKRARARGMHARVCVTSRGVLKARPWLLAPRCRREPDRAPGTQAGTTKRRKTKRRAGMTPALWARARAKRWTRRRSASTSQRSLSPLAALPGCARTHAQQARARARAHTHTHTAHAQRMHNQTAHTHAHTHTHMQTYTSVYTHVDNPISSRPISFSFDILPFIFFSRAHNTSIVRVPSQHRNRLN